MIKFDIFAGGVSHAKCQVDFQSQLDSILHMWKIGFDSPQQLEAQDGSTVWVCPKDITMIGQEK